MKTSLHSSYWLDELSLGKLKSTKELDPIELAKYQKVISNFVQILTKKRIPVKYNTAGTSYTDSKKVVIGSSISSKTFDSVVGLALHEASHIKLTDFSILPNIFKYLGETGLPDELIEKISDRIRNNWELGSHFKNILNYIEDRRIDYFVYTNAPGYKNYYQQLYKRYFESSTIDKGLKSDQYRDSSDIESYMFRITNLTNKNSDLDALPGLRQINDIIFPSVKSISSTKDSLKLTAKVFEIILENLEKETEVSESSESNEKNDKNSDQSETKGSGDSTDESGENSPSNESEMNSGDTESTEGEGNQSGSDSEQSSKSENDNFEELTEKQKEKLKKDFQKQKDFLNGDISKRKINKTLESEVKAAVESDMDTVDVSYETEMWNGETFNVNQKVIVVRGLNEKTIQLFDSYRERYRYYSSNPEAYNSTSEFVSSGISLGKRLGKKLQIRNYERETVVNRKKKGKVDRRRLHAIGSEDFNVFYQSEIEKYADAFLHLSIDGSGSMHGTNFYNSLKSAVSIAQMGVMTNLDVQISLRITTSFGGKDRPVMWIVYDSRKDSMATIKKYFKYLDVSGYTPEGLCFDSIMKELPIGNDSLKTYFINYSDGMPYFNNYGGDMAVEHTRKQVNKLKEKGYSVLSFFITGYSDAGVSKDFERMYGKSSSNINPTNLPKLVNTLQKMFVNNK